MNYVYEILDRMWNRTVEEVYTYPTLMVLVVLGVLSRVGTVVQTGWKGVLFSFGRARRELDPGFYWLMPFVQRVRKVPIRSVTIHLPAQVVTTADGLVYEVQANLVYRIVAPTKSVVQIGNLHGGLESLVPVVLQKVVRTQTHVSLLDRDTLNSQFADLAARELERWGLIVETAGFTTIAPTPHTLRILQLARRVTERERVVNRYGAAGLPTKTALALLGIDRRIVAHNKWRYRKAVRLRRQKELAERVAQRKQRLLLEERYRKGEYIPSDEPNGGTLPTTKPAAKSKPEASS